MRQFAHEDHLDLVIVGFEPPELSHKTNKGDTRMAHPQTSAGQSAKMAETVAILGAGETMGFAMARNIARAGIPVRAWNRTRGKAESPSTAMTTSAPPTWPAPRTRRA